MHAMTLMVESLSWSHNCASKARRGCASRPLAVATCPIWLVRSKRMLASPNHCILSTAWSTATFLLARRLPPVRTLSNRRSRHSSSYHIYYPGSTGWQRRLGFGYDPHMNPLPHCKNVWLGCASNKERLSVRRKSPHPRCRSDRQRLVLRDNRSRRAMVTMFHPLPRLGLSPCLPLFRLQRHLLIDNAHPRVQLTITIKIDLHRPIFK